MRWAQISVSRARPCSEALRSYLPKRPLLWRRVVVRDTGLNSTGVCEKSLLQRRTHLGRSALRPPKEG
eukprot:7426219-Heterocapsa_arctica.AAC.1